MNFFHSCLPSNSSLKCQIIENLIKYDTEKWQSDNCKTQLDLPRLCMYLSTERK